MQCQSRSGPEGRTKVRSTLPAQLWSQQGSKSSSRPPGLGFNQADLVQSKQQQVYLAAQTLLSGLHTGNHSRLYLPDLTLEEDTGWHNEHTNEYQCPGGHGASLSGAAYEQRRGQGQQEWGGWQVGQQRRCAYLVVIIKAILHPLCKLHGFIVAAHVVVHHGTHHLYT